MSVYAYRPLEVAVETATVNLMDWMIADHGFTPTDAYCLVSTCPDFRINVYQMCKVSKLNATSQAPELPKRSRHGMTVAHRNGHPARRRDYFRAVRRRRPLGR